MSHKKPPTSPLLTRLDVATMCACSRTQTYKLEELDGFPKPVILHGKARWFEDEVAAYLRNLPRKG